MNDKIRRAILNDSMLKIIADQLVDKYRQNLDLLDANATHTLRDSAQSIIEIPNDNTISLFFMLEHYWEYLENGPRPHFPPLNAIEKWIQDKGIKPVPRGKSGKVPSVRQLAYAICKSMAKGKVDTDGQLKAYISKPALSYMVRDNQELIDQFVSRISEIIAEQSNLEIESFMSFT